MISSKLGLVSRPYTIDVPTVSTPSVLATATIAKQKKREWCWAAVIASLVSARFSPGNVYSEQCRLAFDTLRHGYMDLEQADCCDESSSAGDVPIAPAWMNGAYPDLPSPLSIAGLAETPPAYTEGPIAPASILSALAAGHVVCVGIRWNTGKSHFVAIVGVRALGGAQQFQVGDPTHGSTYWLSYDSIRSYHTDQIGVWAFTYVV